jgi:rhamnogalacturonyl hydrolase YesR
MAPPFIAYYGALEEGSKCQELLQAAYDQVRLYREVLYDPSVMLWRHIALGNGTDPTHWATGNAWVAAGMLRVLATIQRSQATYVMKSQQLDLVNWVGEILDGAWCFQVCVVSVVLGTLEKSCDTESVRACVYTNSKRTARS